MKDSMKIRREARSFFPLNVPHYETTARKEPQKQNSTLKGTVIQIM